MDKTSPNGILIRAGNLIYWCYKTFCIDDTTIGSKVCGVDGLVGGIIG